MCLNEGNAAQSILETSPQLLVKLLALAKSVDPGERQIVMENHCEEMRSLFKEYVRPVHHELSPEKKRTNMPCQFDIMREFPTVFGCVFSRELTSVHYVCDPRDNTSTIQPRGALIFADKPFPERVSRAYIDLYKTLTVMALKFRSQNIMHDRVFYRSMGTYLLSNFRNHC